MDDTSVDTSPAVFLYKLCVLALAVKIWRAWHIRFYMLFLNVSYTYIYVYTLFRFVIILYIYIYICIYK